MKSLRIVSLLAVFALAFGLTGCGDEAPEVDENLLLQESLFNLSNAGSLRYEIDFDADVLDEGEEYLVEVDASGAYSGLDPENRGTELNVVLKADSPDGKYRFDFSLKEVSGLLYLKLLDLPSVPNMPIEMFADFTDTWWQLEGAQSSDLGLNLTGTGGFGVAYEELSETEKQIRDLILTSKFFKDIEFKGNESVKGNDAYHYSLAFDADAINAYTEQAYQIRGEEITPEDRTAIEEFATSIQGFVGDVWVDADTTTLVKIAGPFDSAEGMKGEFEVAMFDINQPFAVKGPVDFEIFDLAMFFGAFVESGGF
jgi:hypothetical protein